MTYKWTPEGPAFEFPSPFASENRFRAVRAYILFACAALLVLVLLFVQPAEVDPALANLGLLAEPPSVWPHVVAVLILVLLGGLDLYRVSRQRLLTLVPRQPASLMIEVPREGSGVSPGAAGLMRALSEGVAEPVAVGGPFESWLKRLGPDIGVTPAPLQRYLRAHFSQAALAAGLLLILLAGMLAFRPPGLAVAALGLAGLMAAVMAWHRLGQDQPVCPPWLVGLIVAVGLAVMALALVFSAAIPRPDALQRLGLPVAAGVLLAAGLIVELLGIRAARGQIESPRLSGTEGAQAQMEFDAEIDPLMREVDLEFHRRWTEGIPNRRYAWQVPQPSRQQAQGTFTATVLEESQPLGPRVVSSAGLGAARAQGTLRLMDSVGLLLSTAGGVAWVLLAYVQMQNPAASWAAGPLGLALLLAGGHALRVAHLLWSRVELESTITWLEMKGGYTRRGDGASAERAPLRAEGVHLQARVLQARSVFYAAAAHRLGSRVLVHTMVDQQAATGWTTALSQLARQVAVQQASMRVAAATHPASPAAPRPAAVGPRATVVPSRPVTRAPDLPAPVAPAARRAGRFCSACGTAVMAQARFCQNCGQVLGAD